MIYHYVNLVMWEDISVSFDANSERCYCDSITMLIAARLCGIRLTRRPGTQAIQALRSSLTASSTLVLAKNAEPNPDGFQVFALPWYDSFIYIPAKLKATISQSKPHTLLVGISSPKQNELARQLQKITPKSDIFCLGAALNYNNDAGPGRNILSQWSLEWMSFLYRQPRRTILKIGATIQVFIMLCVKRAYRKKFSQFCNACFVKQ